MSFIDDDARPCRDARSRHGKIARMSPVPPDEPALALAIDFLNTYDTLEAPPDRLSVDLAQRVAGRHGYPVTFAAGDLEPLRALRERLRPVFAAADVDSKLAAINGVLEN